MSYMSFSSPISYNPQVHHLHVVKDGESLGDLAESHGIRNVAEILSDNPGCDFRPGDLVVIQLKRSLQS
ncbi:MAG: LysM peptidoglycan-binding domain-containing protein [Candidatus Saganbacteria bacterium]|nr:LysM peptidoglycan-binding domain-containing protein [Candidatus Saganbacteria bacterium]